MRLRNLAKNAASSATGSAVPARLGISAGPRSPSTAPRIEVQALPRA